MRILVIADIHGKFEMLQKIMDAVEKEEFDVIVAPGDFTDMFDVPPNFTQLDIADIVIQKLLIPRKPLLCTPGNHDPYEILEVFEEYGVDLHGKRITKAGIDFVGWGGAATPFNTLFEPTEEETREVLGGLAKKEKGGWVLVTHAPPAGTKMDAISTKEHVGSETVRAIIAESKPLLAITAHIHENSGTDSIGETTVFYPGPAYNGFYGIASIVGNKVDCVIKKAR